jgi:hypothetical protein
MQAKEVIMPSNLFFYSGFFIPQLLYSFCLFFLYPTGMNISILAMHEVRYDNCNTDTSSWMEYYHRGFRLYDVSEWMGAIFLISIESYL